MIKQEALILAVALALSGCASKTATTNRSGNSREILPLKVGNTFIAKKDYYDLRNGSNYLTKYDTLSIVGKDTIDGEVFYVSNTNQYLIDRADGYWSGKGKIEEAKFPGEVGDTFFSYFKITNENPPDTVTANWTIVSKSEQVTVPAGTFTCYKYEREAIGKSGRLHLRNFTWWAPGYGLIKREDYYPDEHGKLFLIGSEELIKVELK